jgi:PST family polysaccharide transporter
MTGDPAGSDVGALGQRAARSFAWSAVSYAGTRLLLFAMTVALTRLLAPAEFGVVAAGMAVVSFLELALDLGVGASLVYEQQSGLTGRVQTAFTLNLLVAAALTVAGVLAAPGVAALLGAPEEAPLYRVLFLYLLIRGAGQVQDAVLKRDLGFRVRAGIDLTRATVRVVLAVALAAVGAGAWSIVLSLLAAELVGTGLSWWATRFRPTFELDRDAGRALLRFGLAVVTLKVVDAIALDSDYLIVGARLGPTALGYYTIAYRLPELVLFNVYWIFSTVAFPVYARYRQRGLVALRTVMLRALRLITMFSFPAGVGLALVSRDAVVVLFGPRWAPATLPMALLALTTAAESIGYASGDIFAATGRPARLLALNVPLTVLLVVGMVLVAPRGIGWVAAAHLTIGLGYAPARLLLANRAVGATIAEDLVALRPGVVAALGVLAGGLPLRLMLPVGSASLVAIASAGAAGALVALVLLERPALQEAWALRRLVTVR